LITHGLCGGFLTYGLFKSDSDKQLSSVDECHYTCDSALVYTYLHFKNPVSPKSMSLFMERVRNEMNIIPFEIFGYDSVAASSPDSDLVDHVSFKVLLDHYIKKNPSFHSCTDGAPGVVRGLLWNSDHVSRLRDMAHQRSKRLGLFYDAWEAEYLEFKKKVELIEMYQEQVAEYQHQADHYFFVSHVLKDRISELDRELQEILLEPDHNGRPLF